MIERQKKAGGAGNGILREEQCQVLYNERALDYAKYMFSRYSFRALKLVASSGCVISNNSVADSLSVILCLQASLYGISAK